MSWFSEGITRQSEKNGLITATRHWGEWTVRVEGIEQTGREVHAMWEDAFKKIKIYRGGTVVGRKIKNILALGLGGGGELKNLYTFFPGASITVVEHDPEMVALAKELGLYKPFPFPRVICEDAGVVVPTLTERYELIILDLFHGPEPSALATSESFLTSLNEKLADEGFLIANVFQKPEYREPIAQVFTPLRLWKFDWNHLGLFRKKSPVPEGAGGFLPLSNWPEFNPVSEIPKFFKPKKIEGDTPGVSWRIWPFTFISYRGDLKPKEEKTNSEFPVNVRMWQRIRSPEVPSGWLMFSAPPSRMTGYTPVLPEYEKRWSENTRRMRRDWLQHYADKKHAIEEIQFPEFKKNYTGSTLPIMMRYLTIGDIAARLSKKTMPMNFYGARRIADGKLMAGIAVMRSPALNISYYYAGFFKKEVKDEPVMVGLFDYWFKTALASGIHYIDFGNFWKKGDPRSWKGFSIFKAKFAPTYFFHQPTLYQFHLNWSRKSDPRDSR